MQTPNSDPQGVVILLIFTVVYFLPGIIGLMKGKNNAGAIFLLNLLAGWTFIGWVAALIWAATNDPKGQINHTLAYQNRAIEEAFLKKQRIDQVEFNRKRNEE